MCFGFDGLPLGHKQELEFAGMLVAGHHLGGCHWRNEGAVKSLHPMLAAGEMLGCWGSCRTDSLQTGIRKISPAHRAKCHSVASGLDFQTARKCMPQLVQVCCSTACTNAGICQCYPLHPACPVCPSLQSWPRAGDAGSLRWKKKSHFVLANALMAHARLPGGRWVLCSWDVWKAQTILLVVNAVLLPRLAPHCSLPESSPMLTPTGTSLLMH